VKRAAFRAQIACLPLEKLVFLDECGFSLNLHRLYGWVVGGGRCYEAVPFNKGGNRSVLGAFSLPSQGNPSDNPSDNPSGNPSGMWALWQKLGAWNALLFEAFVEEALLPVLPKGSVLVLDNARIHQGQSLREKVEAAGCSLLFLPPYSPDFNPIELAWSWIKHCVRTLAPRDDLARQSAIECAHRALPPDAARHWFRKSGLC